MKAIKFGTDGWRAIIGDDFIPKNIEIVAQAYAEIHKRSKTANKPVYIGYDRRDQARESAELITSVLIANQIETYLSNDCCPTPTVSWMVKHNNAEVGIMVTASHNPSKWNGIKFKEGYGGSASPEFTNMIEAEIEKGVTPKKAQFKDHGLFHYFDPKKEYVDHIKTLVDMDLIKSANFNCLVDPLYGSGAGYFKLLLGDTVTEIHSERDITFGGIHPEPIPPHVNEAIETMKNGNYSACIINDGDADRLGAIDENGNYITTHLLFSILIKHVVENKGWSGEVIKSISTTQMIDRLCKKYGLALETTLVGFKYISPKLNQPGVMVGGEESGGFGFPVHVCERDGVLCGLLLLENMATRKMTLGQLVDEIQKEVGPIYYKRLDLKLTDEKISEVKDVLNNIKLKEIAGKKVKKFTDIDGWHYLLADDSWLLVRTSGTEPLMRIYVEAASPDRVNEMHKFVNQMLKLN